MKVSEFADLYWWPLKEKNCRPSTLAGYRCDYDNLILPRWGDVEMEDVRAMDIEMWLAGMSHGQALNALGALRRILRRAEGKDFIVIDPTRKDIEIPREHHVYRPPALETYEVVPLIRGFWGHPLEALVTVSVLGGLRRCEACALYWSDIDLREGIVKICKGYQCVNGECVEGFVKTRFSDRIQALPMTAVRRLREIRGKGPLVPDEDGNRMNPDRVARMYKRHCRAEGLPYVPLSNLRHTYARLAMSTGEIDNAIARQLMGHSENSKMLENNYFRSTKTIAKGAAKSIDRMLTI